LDSVLSKCFGALRSFHAKRSNPAGQAVRGIRSQVAVMKNISCCSGNLSERKTPVGACLLAKRPAQATTIPRKTKAQSVAPSSTNGMPAGVFFKCTCQL
jgi:hypothetical protein